jgi:uncharacterized membrane protein
MSSNPFSKLPSTSVMVADIISRTVVIGVISYFVFDLPSMENLKIGGAGAVGSILSQSFIEPNINVTM